MTDTTHTPGIDLDNLESLARGLLKADQLNASHRTLIREVAHKSLDLVAQVRGSRQAAPEAPTDWLKDELRMVNEGIAATTAGVSKGCQWKDCPHGTDCVHAIAQQATASEDALAEHAYRALYSDPEYANKLALSAATTASASDTEEAAKLQTLLTEEFACYRTAYGLYSWAYNALADNSPYRMPAPSRDTALLDKNSEKQKFIAWGQVFHRNARSYTARDFDHGLTAWLAAKSDAAQAPHAGAITKPLAHGHRDDWYLLANARRIAQYPIRMIRTMPNWALAHELFATGSNSARQICIDAGIDPDATTISRAAIAASAAQENKNV